MNNHPRNTRKDGVCELCDRTVDELTRHHLMPRTTHRTKRLRRDHKIEVMYANTLWLCHACHGQVHAIFSEKELGDVFNSRERLLGQSDIKQFVEWISAKPAGFKARNHLKRRI